MLLTFFMQVRCSVKQCCITHSLSRRNWIDKSAYNDTLTHLLLVIWCAIGLLTKNQNWVMPLTSCRSWGKTADHSGQYDSQTVVMRQYIRFMVVQYHLPTDINIIIWSHQPRIWWHLTCASFSCSFKAIWSMTNLVFMWRHWSVTYLLMNFSKHLSFHMKATYLPFHLFPFEFSYANVQFDKNTYPEMWEFYKNCENDIIPCAIFLFQNMSEQCQC